MRNSGKSGSTPHNHHQVTETFTMEDVLYLYSYKNNVEKLYDFLKAYYYFSKENKREISFTKFRVKNGGDSHLLPIMKDIDLATEDSLWKPDRLPSKSDAVYLALLLKKYYQEKKSK